MISLPSWSFKYQATNSGTLAPKEASEKILTLSCLDGGCEASAMTL